MAARLEVWPVELEYLRQREDGSRNSAVTTQPQVFAADALEANRRGELTDAQRQRFQGLSSYRRKDQLRVAALLLAVGLLIMFLASPSAPYAAHVLVPLGCFALAALLVMRSLTGGDALTRDLRRGRVRSVEGAIGKSRAVSTDESTGNDYFLDVGASRFVSPNIQRRNEARATIAGIGNAMQAAFAPVTPPAAEACDPRPLAEAILGTWSNGFLTVTFSADGGVTAQGVGRGGPGRWSVDSEGQLHAQLGGQTLTARAWVTGDNLVVAAQRRSFTLSRRP
jgi:hypothetical protein